MLPKVLVIQNCLVKFCHSPSNWLSDAGFGVLSASWHRVSQETEDLNLKVDTATGIENNQALGVVFAGYFNSRIENEAVVALRSKPDVIS